MSASIRLRISADTRMELDDFDGLHPSLALLTPNGEVAVTLLAAFEDDDALAAANRLVDWVTEWRDGVRDHLAKQAAPTKKVAA